jgi:4-alpha-glucanotransferase
MRKRPSTFTFDRRSCGLLLHPTSLPGAFGSGDIGPEAHKFVDFIAAAGQRWWQMLPVGPPGDGNSPYSAQSAFAGSALLISLDALVDNGLLERGELKPLRFKKHRVEYDRVGPFRQRLLLMAYARFLGAGGTDLKAFKAFVVDNAFWLDDYALFGTLKLAFKGRPWARWPRQYRRRDPKAIARAKETLGFAIGFEHFIQFEFDRQWRALRARCAKNGIGLIGDIPIFVAYDSAEVWANPRLFLLDRDLRPTVVSGCPPDFFSANGQRWGHPHYNWAVHRKDGYHWWIERFRFTLKWFDAVRIDHFLGFHRVWHVPARSKTAKGGRYVPGPGAPFFDTLRNKLGDVPIIAEDLGAVVPEALAVRDRFNFPGMRVLQFGFGDGGQYHLPHNYPRRAVVYTGTHDNDTTGGWLRSIPARERTRVAQYAGDAHVWPLIRLAMSSVADTAIFPVQDLLELGREARMNLPGVADGNWAWRLPAGKLTPALAKRLRAMGKLCERT